MKRNLGKPRLVIFDLDGTLTESKASIAPDMSRLFLKLLEVKQAAVIVGGSFPQFQRQLGRTLKAKPELLKNLFLFPETSTLFYRYGTGRRKGWQKVYAKGFPRAEKKRIIRVLKQVLPLSGYRKPEKTYGPIIEDRGSQITFSALGQDVVKVLGTKRGVALKEKWRKTSDVRAKLVRLLKKRLPEYEHEAGLTSVDITRRGVDKAYGVRQIKKALKVPIRQMLFVGDALSPGGNDYEAKKSGVRTAAVRGPKETERIIKILLKN